MIFDVYFLAMKNYLTNQIDYIYIVRFEYGIWTLGKILR